MPYSPVIAICYLGIALFYLNYSQGVLLISDKDYPLDNKHDEASSDKKFAWLPMSFSRI